MFLLFPYYLKSVLKILTQAPIIKELNINLIGENIKRINPIAGASLGTC
jgi:hypothetical protein